MPLDILEELHVQGQRVRRHLAYEARQVGNIYFQRFNAATTAKAKLDLSEDVMVEYVLAMTEQNEQATVCANAAALYLALKE